MARSKSPLFHSVYGGRRGEAFTLIELLVVMLVIGILATLLLPTLRRARQGAHGAVCKSNLRQIGIALASYTIDYRAYPFFFDADSGGPTLGYWPELLQPYSGAAWDLNLGSGRAETKSKVYLCPGYASLPRLYNGYLPLEGHDLGAYSYNWKGTWLGHWWLGLGGAGPSFPKATATRETEVLKPGAMIAIADAAFGVTVSMQVFGWTEFSSELGFYNYEVESGNVVSPAVEQNWKAAEKRNVLSSIRNRHGGKWNAVFCDAHVEGSRTPQLFDWRSDVVLSLRNKDNQPHRELQSDPPQ